MCSVLPRPCLQGTLLHFSDRTKEWCFKKQSIQICSQKEKHILSFVLNWLLSLPSLSRIIQPKNTGAWCWLGWGGIWSWCHETEQGWWKNAVVWKVTDLEDEVVMLGHKPNICWIRRPLWDSSKMALSDLSTGLLGRKWNCAFWIIKFMCKVLRWKEKN